jgi:hypothetical protein
MADDWRTIVCDRLDSLEASLTEAGRLSQEQNLALNRAVASLEGRMDDLHRLLGLGLWRDDPEGLEKRVEGVENHLADVERRICLGFVGLG